MGSPSSGLERLRKTARGSADYRVMSRRPVVLPIFVFAALAISRARGDDGAAFFEKKIRPLFIEQCAKCHSSEAAKVKGGLRLDSREAILHGGDSGAAIVPGDPEKSLLIQAVCYTDKDLKMPPPKDGADRRLSDAQIADLSAWVKMGAPIPPAFVSAGDPAKHWAFQPISNPPVPAVKDGAWPKTSIDSFFLAKLESDGLAPAPPADKRTLLRRATYDLTGMPPTPEECDAFLADAAPDAFAKVVERLLAAPAYGEKWGRKWLDVVHYADSSGNDTDHPTPLAWRYRNYVIKAFNSDIPYDQFLREQLAGDLLAAAQPRERFADCVSATGYLAVSRRFGSGKDDRDVHLDIEDTIDTLGKTVLGLTVGCARCHNHKYDPISARDYYGLYGIFASTRFSFPGGEHSLHPRDLVPLLPPDELEKLAAAEAATKARDAAESRLRRKVRWTLESLKDRFDGVTRQLTCDTTPAPESPGDRKPDLAYAVTEGTPANARVQKRGEPKELGDEVPRKNFDLLGGQQVPPDAGSGRVQLAGWLTAPQNPLTARVMVNRIWLGHFGRGLVATPNDFGTRGAPPTHPELLDHLATKFMDCGWSVKAMHRLILLSAAYQQGSQPGGGFPRRRLDAEEIRDTYLALAGELDRTPNYGHPFPSEDLWAFSQHDPFRGIYDSPKRSVYLMVQRHQRHPFLSLFDGADPNSSTAQRNASTVPTQALWFLNAPFFHDRAEAFAMRLFSQRDDAQRLALAYRLCLQRTPTELEARSATAFLAAYSRENTGAPARECAHASWSAYARVLLSCNELLYLD